MATKTLSVDEEAYNILTKARNTPTESFSKVIKRGQWEKRPLTCGEFLEKMKEVKEVMSDEQLDYLDAAQKADVPGISKWDL
jgi:predicted CopG family antitoxin